MNPQKHQWWKLTFRDIFLGGLALAILYDQVLVAAAAQPILVGLIVFLLGSIPALRGDRKQGEYGPFARVVMLMMGVKLPSDITQENLTEQGITSGTATHSEHVTHGPSGGQSSVPSEQSRTSSSMSHKD